MKMKLFLSTTFFSIIVSYVSSTPFPVGEELKALDKFADWCTGFFTKGCENPAAQFKFFMAEDVIVKYQGEAIHKKFFLNDAKDHRYAGLVKTSKVESGVYDHGVFRRWTNGKKVLSFKCEAEDWVSGKVKIVEIEIPGIYRKREGRPEADFSLGESSGDT